LEDLKTRDPLLGLKAALITPVPFTTSTVNRKLIILIMASSKSRVATNLNRQQDTESTKVRKFFLIILEFVDRFKSLHNNSGRFVSGVPGGAAVGHQGVPNTGPTNAQQLY